MTSSLRRGMAAAALMLMLIIDTRTAVSGAQEGVILCVSTVIPSLFPFFVLSSLLTSSLTSVRPCFLTNLERLLGMPSGSGTLFLLGLLGGYPTGAQAVADTFRAGQLRKESAQRMLCFCSNAGPAFIFGIAAAHLSTPVAAWALWGIQALSAGLSAMLLPECHDAVQLRDKPITLTQAFEQSLRSIARVCGWIILFRVLITFLNRWLLWYLDTPWQIALNGVLELTNGCTALSYITDEGLRFVLCSGLLSFGGLCVTMQTASVVQPLSIRIYLLGKVIQCVLSVIIAMSYMRKSLLLLILVIIPVFFLHKLKIRVDFPVFMLYNRIIHKNREERPCSSESA